MDPVGAVTIERFSNRADAAVRLRVVVEVFGPVVFSGFLRVRLVVEGGGQSFLFVLILEVLVQLAHPGVGDQRRYLLFGQRLEVGVGVIVGIRRDQRSGRCASGRLLFLMLPLASLRSSELAADRKSVV